MSAREPPPTFALRLVLCLLPSLCLLPVRFATAQQAVPATAVKAVFLYRFAGYVQWPGNPNGPFSIAVVDAPEVAAQLTQLLPDHPIQGRRAQVRSISRPSELQDAQILYIGPDYHGNLHSLIAPLANRPVLVVTDAPNGLAAGGIVNFLIEQQHVRFEVSMGAARRAGLKISSDLLAVAVRVQTGLLIPRPGRTLARGDRAARRYADERGECVDLHACPSTTTASRACPAAGTSCRRA